MSVAKEGKVLEQKKLLQQLLGTPEGIHSGCIIIFSTSAPSAVYSSGQPLIFFRAADLLHLIQVCTMHSSDIYLYQVP